MQIESIIIQRLSERGRVQIPSWGTFYLMEKPARWDAVTNTAFPRGKYVGFTPSNTTTENSLLPAVMKQMRCTMEIAESWIARKVNQWQSTLDSGSILLLQGLGSFRKNDQLPTWHRGKKNSIVFNHRFAIARQTNQTIVSAIINSIEPASHFQTSPINFSPFYLVFPRIYVFDILH